MEELSCEQLKELNEKYSKLIPEPFSGLFTKFCEGMMDKKGCTITLPEAPKEEKKEEAKEV